MAAGGFNGCGGLGGGVQPRNSRTAARIARASRIIDASYTSSQRGTRLLDPSRGAHLLEKAEGALNEDPVFLLIIALAKAPVGQQCLRQLGP